MGDWSMYANMELYIATCSQGSVTFWNGHNCLVQCVREAEKTNKHVHELKLL